MEIFYSMPSISTEGIIYSMDESESSTANFMQYNETDTFEQNGLMCVKCNKQLGSKSALLFHSKLHSIDCCICNDNLVGMEEYERHFLENHSSDDNINASLTLEELSHFSCDETFSLFTKEDRPSRNLTWASLVGRIFTCKICNLQFSSKSSLKFHNLNHIQKQLATCCSCGTLFIQSEDFIESCSESCRLQHLSSMCVLPVKSKSELYKCDSCPKSFGSQGNLNRHKLIHSDIKNYLCDICHEAFTQRISLQKHYLIHAEIKPYVCEFCEKTFSSKAILIEHRATHRDDNVYPCVICGMQVVGKRNFKRHSSEHLPGQKSSCEICGKDFATKKKLQLHLLIHSTDRPFKCSICDRGFTYSSHLKRHYLSHTGERPYACGICGESFIAKYSLTYHLNKHKKDGDV